MKDFIENRLREQGFLNIAGVDEVGRGPLAGPVVAAAVILPQGINLPGLRDSKQVPPSQRLDLFKLIRKKSLTWGLGIVPQGYIDQTNILKASLLAMEKAVSRLSLTPDYLLIDGISSINSTIPQSALKQGDARCPSIAAASILAKVIRDRIMEAIDLLYPQYGFSRNKGYGTREHIEALKEYGPCPWHRKTFRRVKELLLP
jgi:ribonuclease HII